MSTATEKSITAEEFFDWVQLPAHRGRRFELIQGEVIETPPPGKYHGFVCGNVSRILGNYAIQDARGYVCTNDAGVIVGRNPDSVRGPDVTFYDDEETAETMERQFSNAPPLLAVEVVSPSDRINEIMLRVAQLLHQGVKVVWVVDPETRDVSVCKVGQEPVLVGGNEFIGGGDELPEFRCCVSEFFSTPAKSK